MICFPKKERAGLTTGYYEKRNEKVLSFIKYYHTIKM